MRLARMRLAKIESWRAEPLLEEHPIVVSSADWLHTKLVDHVNVPLGSDFMAGCERQDLERTLWEKVAVHEVIRASSVKGLGERISIQEEVHLEVLGVTIRSRSERPIRVKNLEDGSQYILVKPEAFHIFKLEGALLDVGEQVKLYKVREGLSLDLSGLELYGSSCIRFPEISLRGVDLSGGVFTDVDFSGLDFEGANLSRARFNRCSFKGALLKGANLSEAELEDVDFSEARLEGATLKEASFVGVNFTKSWCDGVDFTEVEYDYDECETDCINGYLNEPRLIFNGARLKGAKFDGLSLNHAQFEGADLTEASFKGCDLSSCKTDDYCGYVSEGTSFKGAVLEGVDFEGALLEGAILAGRTS
jgi:uncharacterized protein YjbI with pentapeptide repeats